MSFPPGTEMFQFPGFASLAGYFLAEVGCPIRRPMDQSSFAAPHGFSQRTTSFIASQRQGIHRMPLSHLITLIIDAHARVSPRRRQHRERPLSRVPSGTGAVSTQPSFRAFHRKSLDDHGRRTPRRSPSQGTRTVQTNLLFTMTDRTGDPHPGTANLLLQRTFVSARSTPIRCSAAGASRDVHPTPNRNAKSRTGSQPRRAQNLEEVQARATQEPGWRNQSREAVIGGARRDRTDDLMLAKHALSQLSYGPNERRSSNRTPSEGLVGPERFELSTSRLSSARSNQLSYGPKPRSRPDDP